MQGVLQRLHVQQAARRFNLEYWPAKVQAEDLKLVKAYIQFILEDYKDLGNLKPTELLRHMETRLVTTDQLEFKRMRF